MVLNENNLDALPKLSSCYTEPNLRNGHDVPGHEHPWLGLLMLGQAWFSKCAVGFFLVLFVLRTAGFFVGVIRSVPSRFAD